MIAMQLDAGQVGLGHEHYLQRGHVHRHVPLPLQVWLLCWMLAAVLLSARCRLHVAVESLAPSPNEAAVTVSWTSRADDGCSVHCVAAALDR